MRRELHFTPEARANLKKLEDTPADAGILKQVRKALGYLEQNPLHPSLSSHKYESLRGPDGVDVFEAYAQNKTPGAYRIFFHYGPDRRVGKKRVPGLTIVAITPHP